MKTKIKMESQHADFDLDCNNRNKKPDNTQEFGAKNGNVFSLFNRFTGVLFHVCVKSHKM